jgi:tetratricopeptide (TPR) repeat protein
MIGPALAVAWWLAGGWNTAKAVVCLALLVVLAFGSFRQAGHWLNDETLFTHALTINPDSNVAHASLGYRRYNDALVRRRAGDEQGYREAFDRAVKHYQAAVLTNPYDFRTQNHLAWAMREQRNLDEAEKHYRAAIDAKPDFAAAHNNLGLLYAERRDWDEAARLFTQAAELEPDYAEAVNNRAQVHAEVGAYDDAIAGFRRAIALKRDYAAPHFNLAEVFVQQGRYDEAIHEYRRALEIAPDFTDAKQMLDAALRLRQARLGN